MKPVTPRQEHCPADALKLLGDYTTLRVIDQLRTEEMRFTELQRALGDANSVTLTNRLKRMEAAGLLQRMEATYDRQSVIYRLSDMGRGLLPVLREIQAFATRYRDAVPRVISGSADLNAAPQRRAASGEKPRGRGSRPSPRRARGRGPQK
jgi:DNA-binding HxlR family transcriptional regulator